MFLTISLLTLFAFVIYFRSTQTKEYNFDFNPTKFNNHFWLKFNFHVTNNLFIGRIKKL